MAPSVAPSLASAAKAACVLARHRIRAKRAHRIRAKKAARTYAQVKRGRAVRSNVATSTSTSTEAGTVTETGPTGARESALPSTTGTAPAGAMSISACGAAGGAAAAMGVRGGLRGGARGYGYPLTNCQEILRRYRQCTAR